MNKKINDILGYFLQNNKFSQKEIQYYDLIKMAYVADWIFAYIDSVDFSGLKWKFDDYGPKQNEVSNILSLKAEFNLVVRYNDFNEKDLMVSLSDDFQYQVEFSEREREIMDFVIDIAHKKIEDSTSFDNHVFETYPVIAFSGSDEEYSLKDVSLKLQPMANL